MCPEKRLTVEQCLEHKYFRTEPLPCDKSELPRVEGEAHEHAIREEKKEIRKAIADKEAMRQAMHQMYPTTQDSVNRHGRGGHRGYGNRRGGKPHYAGTKRSRDERDRY